MIKPFDGGWSYILNLFLKLISFLVIWSCNYSNITKKKVTHLGSSIVQVFRSTLNIIPQWISKPWIKRYFKHQKASSGAGQFAINLRKCKYPHYNVQNCKYCRHNQRHFLKQHRLRHKPSTSNITYDRLKIKERKGYTSPSPRRETRMLNANIRYQDDSICRFTRFRPSLFHFNEFDMNNNHLSTNSTYDNHSILNFPLQFIPNQVDSTTDLLDEVVLTEVVMRPTKKPRSVGPHKSILKKNDNQRKSHQENKKFRSVCKPTYGPTVDYNVNNIVKSLRNLVYKSKERITYSHRNTSTLFPIIWKFMKKQSRIIKGISIPDCLPHHGLSHMIKLNTDSSSMLDKDKQLLYDLIKRLLFISKITVPNVHGCTSYIITRMESPSICHENDLLQSDVISTKKLRLFVLSSKKEHCVHLESLLSKHTKYLLKIYEQIIQSGRFKKTSIALKRVLKNVTKWSNNDPNFILTICKLINQGVKTFNNQYYNTHQKSILSDTVTENDIYDNYSYTSCVNWEIEKTSETPSKKLEFYIDNPETGLKKIIFNIINNKDEIDDLNDDIRDHHNNGLTDDIYNNINHNNVNPKQTNHHNDLEYIDWDSIDIHKVELITAYNNKVGNKTLYPRTFYALYVKPNQEGNDHLIV